MGDRVVHIVKEQSKGKVLAKCGKEFKQTPWRDGKEHGTIFQSRATCKACMK